MIEEMLISQKIPLILCMTVPILYHRFFYVLFEDCFVLVKKKKQ